MGLIWEFELRCKRRLTRGMCRALCLTFCFCLWTRPGWSPILGQRPTPRRSHRPLNLGFVFLGHSSLVPWFQSNTCLGFFRFFDIVFCYTLLYLGQSITKYNKPPVHFWHIWPCHTCLCLFLGVVPACSLWFQPDTCLGSFGFFCSFGFLFWKRLV